MDPLSISTGVAGLIALAGSIISTCYGYGCAVKDGPAEIQRLVDEVVSLAGVLAAVGTLIDRATEQMKPNDYPGQDELCEGAPPPYSLQDTRDYFKNLAEPVVGSQKILTEVQEALQKAVVKNEMKVGRIFKRLIWPLKRDRTLEMVASLERYKSLYVLSLSTTEASIALDSQQTLNDIRSTQLADRLDRQIEQETALTRRYNQWLCPVNYVEAHRAARRLCLQGSGHWMLGKKEWQAWWESDQAFLWLYGIPGSGKTVLLSTLLEYCSQHLEKKETVLLYFYCDFRNGESQRSERLVGALVAQLCSQVPEAQMELNKLAEKHRTHGMDLTIPTFEELSELFTSLLSMVSDVVIIVDAVDECLGRTELADFLVNAWSHKSSKVKVLVTSRQEADIEAILSGGGRLSMRVDAQNDEIEFYVSCSMAGTPRLRRLPEELGLLVKKTLVEGCQGMFRWVQCQVDALSKLRTDRDIRQALTRLPRTLYDTYGRILENIEEQDRNVARKALIWLAYGTPSLTLEEITEAAVIDQNTTFKDPEGSWYAQDLLSVIGGLTRYTTTPDVIELAHHSVKEFLQTSKPGIDHHGFLIDQKSGHKEIGDAMLRYLLMKDFDVKSSQTQEEYQKLLDAYPLLPLAARFWPYYARESITSSEETLQLARSLLDPSASNYFRNWVQVLVSQGYNDFAALEKARIPQRFTWRGSRRNWPLAPPNLTPLYYAASFGLLPVVQNLVDAGVPLDENGGIYHGTALHAAIYRGHSEVAIFLINAGANVHVEDVNNMTPLKMALAFHPDRDILKKLKSVGATTVTKLHQAIQLENILGTRSRNTHGLR